MCRYKGTQNLHVIDAKTIMSTVGMIPFPLTEEEQCDHRISDKYADCFYVAEKPFLDSGIPQNPVNELSEENIGSGGDYVNERDDDNDGGDDESFSDSSGSDYEDEADHEATAAGNGAPSNNLF